MIMMSIAEYLAFVFLLALVEKANAVPLPTDYVEYSSRGYEFYIGVIAEHIASPLPSLLVTTDSRHGVNFTISVADAQFEQSLTIRRGSVVELPLPLPPVPPLPPLPADNEGLSVGQTVGVYISAEPGKEINVFVSQRTHGLYTALPCVTHSSRFERHAQTKYNYRLFPPTLDQQPLARGLLLLAGCQDATNIQIFSTHLLSLPPGLNATVESLPTSGVSVMTSFTLHRFETVAISMTGDISSAYVTTSQQATVSLGSPYQCSDSPDENRARCFGNYAQLVPSFTWGRKFLVSSRPSRADGTAEYMIQTDLSLSTRVTVTCRNSTDTYNPLRDHFIRQNAKIIFKVVSKHYCSIESEHQIQVTQYVASDASSGNTPLPLLIPPTEQYFNNYNVPLGQQTLDDRTEIDDSSVFYATIFVSAQSLSSVVAEGNKVMVDDQPVVDGWNDIPCHSSELCGYGVEVQLPLQSTVNIAHQNSEVSFNVLVHRVGTRPFSYAAGFRLNNLTASVVYFESGSYEAVESSTQVELAVMRDGDTSRVTDVLFTTLNNTALGDEDFTAVTTAFRFLPGERRKVVALTILDDQLLEAEEMFNVSLTVTDDRDSVVARENASVTIIDNDTFEVGFEMESYTVDEVTGRLEVSIISPEPYSGSREVVLTMTTMDGTAEAPQDYFPLNVYLPFTAGTQLVSIAIHVFEDSVVESELEWFSLSLDTLIAPAADRVLFTRQNTTIFIEDKNKLQLELAPSSIMVTEGDDSQTGQRSEVTITVFSNGLTDRPITVFLVTKDNTAIAGEDYVALEEVLTFTDNQTMLNVTLEIVGDEVVEGDEVVMAELVVPAGETGVTLKSKRVNVFIIDDDMVEVMFMAGSVTVQEGAGAVELTIVKSGANSRDVFINFATLDGDALRSEDYFPNGGQLAFTSADTSQTVLVAIRDDSVVENLERFLVALSVPKSERGVVLREPRRVAVIIVNDDTVEVGFSEALYTVREEEGLAQLVITKTGSNTRPVGVVFTTTRSTATSPEDYTSVTEIIMFGSDDGTQTVSIPIVNDMRAEPVEMFTVTLIPTDESVEVAADRGEAVVEIIDNDPVMVGFSDSVYTVEEGVVVADITLTKSGVANLPITLQYRTEDDTATGMEDYVPLTDGSVTFSGQSNDLPTIQLRISDDTVPERTEQLLIHLTIPPEVEYALVLETSTATVIILDNDNVRVRFESELYRVSESSITTTVRLLLVGDTSNTVSVTLQTIDQDAVAPGDYPSLATSVVFLAGVTEQTVTVSVVDDSVLEGPEAFSLKLTPLSAGVVTDDTAATVVIEDDDVISLRFQRDLVQTAEDAGVVQVTVELDHPTEVPFTVLVTTLDSTATATEDYVSMSTPLLFSPGVSSAVVDVTIISDAVLEPAERLILTLSSTNDTRATINPSRHMTIIEILDTTEVSVGFMFESVEFSESRDMARVIVAVSGVFQRPLTIQISTLDGTATAGEDYREQSSEVTLPPGNKYHIVEIPLVDDRLYEGNEHFFVEVFSTDANVVISTSPVNVTIREDDSVSVTFDRTSYTVSEDEEEAVIVVRMVENNTLVNVVVNFGTIDDTAIGTTTDYDGEAELLLTFGPAVTQHEVRIPIIDDPALEYTESFLARLTTPPNQQSAVTFIDSQATIYILDNDEVFINFSQPFFQVIEGEPVVFLTLVRSGLSYIDITLNLTTKPESATADVDYVSKVSPIQLQSFQSRQFVPIMMLDDQFVEGNESFLVTLKIPSLQRGVQLTSDPARIIIQENDFVVVMFDPVMYTVLEDEGHVTLTFTVAGNLVISASVTIFTSPHNATATEGEDFVSTTVSVDIQPNDTKISVTVPILDDVIPEGVEIFQVMMSSSSQFVLTESSIAFVQIIDQDGEHVRVGFESMKYVSSETGRQVQVCLTISAPVEEDLSFLIHTEQSSAQDDQDFVPVRRMIQFRAGQLRRCLSITILDDIVVEKTENFLLMVESVPSNDLITEGLIVAPAITEICVTDNDRVSVGFVEASVRVSEGSSTTLVVKVVKVGLTSEAVSVAFMTEDGTARSGVDYTPLNGVLEYSETDSEREIAISIIDDSVLETLEYFSLVLSLPEVEETGVTLARDKLRIEIEDNDVVEIGFVMESYEVSEAQKQVTVCIRKSIPTSTLVSVNVSTQSIASNIAAERFVDYIPVTMIVTFPLGEGNFPECVHIPLLDDEIALEPNEEFRVILSLVNGVSGMIVFSPSSAVVTIVDNDDVSVGFETSSYLVDEDEGTLTLCVTKDKTTVRPIPLLLTATESTPLSATVSGDFDGEAVETSLHTTANVACVTVDIIDDKVHENTQHFDVVLDITIQHPNLKFGRTRNAQVTILDNDIIMVEGTNTTVDESEGSVSICLTMDKKAEIPVSVDLQFSKDVDSPESPAQGGIDYDSTPRSVVFPAGETQSCSDVDIFIDTITETVEVFSVIITTGSNTVTVKRGHSPIITITDNEGPPSVVRCRVLDSVVIEPFRSPTSVADSYTFHSPCEHTLLTTCDPTSSQHLRVTIDFNPSNLNVLGLAVQINRTATLTVSRDRRVTLSNFPAPVLSNRTLLLYPNGVLITTLERHISITLSDFAIKIERFFVPENQIVVEVLEGLSDAAEVCGLCGTVSGELVFSGGGGMVVSTDSDRLEEFAESWRVSPQEVLLGKQGEECGAIRNDTIIGDPLFTVPLDFPSMTSISKIAGTTPHLCYEVHGERDAIFNLISDRCTSVNALFAAMTPPSTGNIMSTIAIKAVDYRGNCIETEVSLQTQCVPVVRGSDGRPLRTDLYNQHGVSIRRNRRGVRVAVPNCDHSPLVMWVVCEENRNQSMIRVIISRGVNLRPTSHGILGQFWNIPVTISPIAPLTSNTLPSPYILTLSPPSSPPRQFLARLYVNTWDKRDVQCYYAGSSQGGPLGELESPHLRDSVIEGRYTHYIMDGLFETEFQYTRFDTRECTSQR